MPKIINRETLLEQRVKNEYTTPMAVFAGDARANLAAKEPETIISANVKLTNTDYLNSAGHKKLWDEIGALQHRAKNMPEDELIKKRRTLHRIQVRLFLRIFLVKSLSTLPVGLRKLVI